MRGLSKVLKRGALALLVLVLLLGAVGFVRVNRFSKGISDRGVFTSEIGKRAGDGGRFNLLVLGYGGENHDGAFLTDSILVYSIPLRGGEASQISVPRDLWIESPPDSGEFRKANAAYAVARARTDDPRKAADATVESLSGALGAPIHGWMTIDFNGFRDLVNALGGVNVNVQREFTARYPENDDPSVSAKWINVKFRKGPQQMDGEQAIRYARARYIADPAEGSDFARAARQQRLLAAIKSKAASPAGLLRSFAIMGAVEDDIQSNVSAGDLARIFRRGVSEERSVVLSTENVLAESTSDDGQYILVPEDGDWESVHRFVQDSLKGRSSAGR